MREVVDHETFEGWTDAVPEAARRFARSVLDEDVARIAARLELEGERLARALEGTLDEVRGWGAWSRDCGDLATLVADCAAACGTTVPGTRHDPRAIEVFAQHALLRNGAVVDGGAVRWPRSSPDARPRWAPPLALAAWIEDVARRGATRFALERAEGSTFVFAREAPRAEGERDGRIPIDAVFVLRSGWCRPPTTPPGTP